MSGGTRVGVKRRLRWRRDWEERGTSLVEFALILPIFALMLFGMVDFGLVFGGFISLRNQVNTAGRNIAVSQGASTCSSSTTPFLCMAKLSIANSELGTVPGTVQVAVEFPLWDTSQTKPTAGDPVQVCAQAQLHSSTGITSAFLNSRTMFASTVTQLQINPNAPSWPSSSGSGTSNQNQWDESTSSGFSCPLPPGYGS